MQTNNIKVVLLRSTTRDLPITTLAKTIAPNRYLTKLLRWDKEPKISKQMKVKHILVAKKERI
jgi:hypothetical protein